MSRDNFAPVTEHKGQTISVSRTTGKFRVDELADCGELPDLPSAKKAIDRAMKALLDVKRRPVIIHEENYNWEDEDGKDVFHFGGELTSFSAHHWTRGNLHANVVRNKERSEYDPDHVYEDTPANRECAKRIAEIGKQARALFEERTRLVEKVMVRIVVPDLKAGEEEKPS